MRLTLITEHITVEMSDKEPTSTDRLDDWCNCAARLLITAHIATTEQQAVAK